MEIVGRTVDRVTPTVDNEAKVGTTIDVAPTENDTVLTRERTERSKSESNVPSYEPAGISLNSPYKYASSDRTSDAPRGTDDTLVGGQGEDQLFSGLTTRKDVTTTDGERAKYVEPNAGSEVRRGNKHALALSGRVKADISQMNNGTSSPIATAMKSNVVVGSVETSTEGMNNSKHFAQEESPPDNVSLWS